MLRARLVLTHVSIHETHCILEVPQVEPASGDDLARAKINHLWLELPVRVRLQAQLPKMYAMLDVLVGEWLYRRCSKE